MPGRSNDGARSVSVKVKSAPPQAASGLGSARRAHPGDRRDDRSAQDVHPPRSDRHRDRRSESSANRENATHVPPLLFAPRALRSPRRAPVRRAPARATPAPPGARDNHPSTTTRSSPPTLTPRRSRLFQTRDPVLNGGAAVVSTAARRGNKEVSSAGSVALPAI